MGRMHDAVRRGARMGWAALAVGLVLLVSAGPAPAQVTPYTINRVIWDLLTGGHLPGDSLGLEPFTIKSDTSGGGDTLVVVFTDSSQTVLKIFPGKAASGTGLMIRGRTPIGSNDNSGRAQLILDAGANRKPEIILQERGVVKWRIFSRPVTGGGKFDDALYFVAGSNDSAGVLTQTADLYIDTLFAHAWRGRSAMLVLVGPTDTLYFAATKRDSVHGWQGGGFVLNNPMYRSGYGGFGGDLASVGSVDTMLTVSRTGTADDSMGTVWALDYNGQMYVYGRGQRGKIGLNNNRGAGLGLFSTWRKYSDPANGGLASIRLGGVNLESADVLDLAENGTAQWTLRAAPGSRLEKQFQIVNGATGAVAFYIDSTNATHVDTLYAHALGGSSPLNILNAVWGPPDSVKGDFTAAAQYYPPTTSYTRLYVPGPPWSRTHMGKTVNISGSTLYDGEHTILWIGYNTCAEIVIATTFAGNDSGHIAIQPPFGAPLQMPSGFETASITGMGDTTGVVVLDAYKDTLLFLSAPNQYVDVDTVRTDSVKGWQGGGLALTNMRYLTGGALPSNIGLTDTLLALVRTSVTDDSIPAIWGVTTNGDMYLMGRGKSGHTGLLRDERGPNLTMLGQYRKGSDPVGAYTGIRLGALNLETADVFDIAENALQGQWWLRTRPNLGASDHFRLELYNTVSAQVAFSVDSAGTARAVSSVVDSLTLNYPTHRHTPVNFAEFSTYEHASLTTDSVTVTARYDSISTVGVLGGDGFMPIMYAAGDTGALYAGAVQIVDLYSPVYEVPLGCTGVDSILAWVWTSNLPDSSGAHMEVFKWDNGAITSIASTTLLDNENGWAMDPNLSGADPYVPGAIGRSEKFLLRVRPYVRGPGWVKLAVQIRWRKQE